MTQALKMTKPTILLTRRPRSIIPFPYAIVYNILLFLYSLYRKHLSHRRNTRDNICIPGFIITTPAIVNATI